jgi:hypothetical protein
MIINITLSDGQVEFLTDRMNDAGQTDLNAFINQYLSDSLDTKRRNYIITKLGNISNLNLDALQSVVQPMIAGH